MSKPTGEEIISVTRYSLHERNTFGGEKAMQIDTSGGYVDYADFRKVWEERNRLREQLASQRQPHPMAGEVEGYGAIQSLSEALEAARIAENVEKLLGYYPAACVVLARALKREGGR